LDKDQSQNFELQFIKYISTANKSVSLKYLSSGGSFNTNLFENSYD